VAATARPSASPAGTILAFDFGTRRIGVAVGEASTGLAHPLATIADERRDARFAAIGKLIDEWRPALLVIGVPTHADGRAHELTANARRFARKLEGRYGIAVAFADERYSTRAAREALAAAGVRARDQRDVRDQVAAQLILQAYLDEQRDRPRTA
jgi:putative holliday junction resolvase